jgi:hypothetical protein
VRYPRQEEFTGFADSETLKSLVRFVTWTSLSVGCVIIALYAVTLLSPKRSFNMTISPRDTEQADFQKYSSSK